MQKAVIVLDASYKISYSGGNTYTKK